MLSPRTVLPVRQTSAKKPPHPSGPVNLTIVCVGPAPRSVTLLLLPKLMPLATVYVPALRNTTWSLGQAAMAALICVVPALEFSVAQIVLVGIPPETPRVPSLQSAARDGLRMPDQSCAEAGDGTVRSRSIKSQLSRLISHSTQRPSSALPRPHGAPERRSDARCMQNQRCRPSAFSV